MRPDFDTLQAVNRMLSAADELPVNTLDSDGVNDTDEAQRILNQKIIQVLGQRWNFNTEAVTYSPDSSGHISLAKSILAIEGSGEDYHSKFSIRNDRLYDVENSTDVFTTDVELLITRWLEFEDIPILHRFYITDSAAREYHQAVLNDPNRLRSLQQIEAESHANMIRTDSKERKAVWGRMKNGTNQYIRTRRGRDPRY